MGKTGALGCYTDSNAFFAYRFLTSPLSSESPRLKSRAASSVLSLVLALIFLLHAAHLLRFEWIDRLENTVYDWRLAATAPSGLDERIVIVDIDEKSLASEGRWPWPRDKVAALLAQLTDHYRVAIVGVDMVFAQADESSGIKRLRRMAPALRNASERAAFEQTLNSLAPQLDFDAQLASTLKKRPVVLGYYFNNSMPPRREGALPPPVLQRGFFGARRVEFPAFVGYTGNLSLLQESALTSGHFNMLPDKDGILRRLPMLVQLDGQYYEALCLAMLRQLIKASSIAPQTPTERWIPASYTGVEALELPTLGGSFVLPVDRQGAVNIPYRRLSRNAGVGSGGFTYLSATDVLNQQIGPEHLKDKIVLLGTSAAGLADLRNTPFSSTLPGVEVHASLLAGMLDGTLKHAPAYMLGFEVILLLLTAIFLGLAFLFCSPLIAALGTALIIALQVALNLALYSQAHLLAPLVSPVLLALAMLLGHSLYGYAVENQRKRRLIQSLTRYVPLGLVEQITQDAPQTSPPAHLASLSLLSVQLQNVNALAEKLPAAEMAQLIHAFLTSVSEQIQTHHGTLDKYIGATALAFWGAPQHDPLHARHAIEAALAIEQELREKLAPQFQTRGWPSTALAIGINSGPMLVGDFGSRQRPSYTAIGPNAGFVSQLQGLSSIYGVNIIAGEATRREVVDIIWRELDKIHPVNQPGQAHSIYEPLGLKGAVEPALLDELACWAQFLKLYRRQQWDLAEVQLINLMQSHPRPLYRLYSSRLTNLRHQRLPAAWDSVYSF